MTCNLKNQSAFSKIFFEKGGLGEGKRLGSNRNRKQTTCVMRGGAFLSSMETRFFTLELRREMSSSHINKVSS